jgi:hypothetical protein
MSEINTPDEREQRQERPGCVSVYAVLLWIGAGLYVLGALLLSVTSLSIDEPVFLFLSCLLIGLAAIPILTGYGLWRMKTWAWAIVVVLQSVGVILGLLSIGLNLIVMSSFADIGGTSGICGSLVGLIVGGVIIYWFTTNRRLFGIGVTTYETVEGPDGELIQQPIAGSGAGGQIAWVIVGIVLVAFVVPICTIFILALLGPAIGNVFSNIILGI